MTLTFPSAIRPSIWNRLRRGDQDVATDGAEKCDDVTGLLIRDAFLDVAQPIVEQAAREKREVAVVSILVGGIDEPTSEYDEEARNEVLSVIGAQLREQMSASDVVGRVGLAEFVWVTMIESRGAGWRYLADVRSAAVAAIAAQPVTSGVDVHVGFTLSRGGDSNLAELIDEARVRRQERSAA